MGKKQFEYIRQVLNTDRFQITPDGVDVFCSVDLKDRKLTEIPFKFRYVFGDFDVSKNNLSSLTNSPDVVFGSYLCYKNRLSDLFGSPTIVTKNFVAYANELISVKGSPLFVGNDVSYSYNKGLESLVGSPSFIGGSFSCFRSDLKSTKGFPSIVLRDVWLNDNQIENLEGLPDVVYGTLHIEKNKNLKSFKGSPSFVMGSVFANACSIKSLLGSPKIVGGLFWVSRNSIESLENSPRFIGKSYMCNNNPLTSFSLPKSCIVGGREFILDSNHRLGAALRLLGKGISSVSPKKSISVNDLSSLLRLLVGSNLSSYKLYRGRYLFLTGTFFKKEIRSYNKALVCLSSDVARIVRSIGLDSIIRTVRGKKNYKYVPPKDVGVNTGIEVEFPVNDVNMEHVIKAAIRHNLYLTIEHNGWEFVTDVGSPEKTFTSVINALVGIEPYILKHDRNDYGIHLHIESKSVCKSRVDDLVDSMVSRQSFYESLFGKENPKSSLYNRHSLRYANTKRCCISNRKDLGTYELRFTRFSVETFRARLRRLSIICKFLVGKQNETQPVAV